MNWLKSKQALPIVVLFLILAMTFLYNLQSGNVSEGRQCEIIDGKCQLSFKKQQFSLSFSTLPIELEEELTLRFTYPQNMQLNAAWVEGVNMFMGKTRIVLSAVADEAPLKLSQGVLFLGSCSEANMRWRLVAEFKDEKSAQTEHFYFNFATSTN